MHKEQQSHPPGGYLTRVLPLLALFLAACGGGSGDGPTPPASGATTIVAGKASFELVPHNAKNGLDYAATRREPIRGAVVQMIAANGGLLATSVTDELGDFSFAVTSGVTARVRVRAQLLQSATPGWQFEVVDNTAGGALYVLESSNQVVEGASQTRNLLAESGWTGSAYTATRAAGPFAILDALYRAYRKVLAVDPQVQFPPLTVNWSVNNRPQSGNLADGAITTSFYQRSADNVAEIYLLGAANADTDEYDDHVVIHEWGHYFEDRLGRSDSVGGGHSDGDRLDPRVAFSEGFGYAVAGMVTDDPNSRDSGGFDQASGFNIDVEHNARLNPGWFSEGSVQTIIYDVYDATADGVDTLTLGFAPIYDLMVGAVTDSVAFTTIFPFVNGLKAAQPNAAAQIDDIVARQGIIAIGMDDYGSGETNDAGNADVLPVYTTLPTDGTAVTVCSLGGAPFGTYNKLSNRRFLRFSLFNSGRYRLAVSGPAGSDPDLIVYRRDAILTADTGGNESVDHDFGAGDYVVEVYEFQNLSEPARGRTCLNVSLTPV